MNSLRDRKGFTLIEVLIVVVIIGILASLILPRMLAQTDKARAAEAIQILGAVSRAQMAYADAKGSYLAAGCTAALGGDAGWINLGLGNCQPGQFDYDCSGTPLTTCQALPKGVTVTTDNVTITLATATAAPTLACAGKYAPAC